MARILAILFFVAAFVPPSRVEERISNDLWIIAMILLSFLTLFFFGTPDFLRKEAIIDRWDILIDGGQEGVTDVFRATVGHLKRLDPPDIRWANADLAPSFWRGLLRDKRPFLIIRQQGNRDLHPYYTYVQVRCYGNALQACWYLGYHPTIWQQIRGRLGHDLDLFDEQDLRAYVTVVHHALVQAVIDLLNELGRDTDINRTSKGFLGVS